MNLHYNNSNKNNIKSRVEGRKGSRESMRTGCSRQMTKYWLLWAIIGN